MAERNLIYFLNQFPAGLTELELQELCKQNPKWFGEYGKLSILGQDKEALLSIR